MKTRVYSSQFSVVVIAIILVSAGVLAFVNRKHSTTTNTAANVNAEVEINAGIEGTNTTISTSVNTAANAATNANTAANLNTSANSNTNSSSQSLSISTVTSMPDKYDGQYVCLTGWYQSSFEFTALAESYRLVAGEKVLAAPYVWFEGNVPASSLTCTTSSAGQQTCQGVITVCGDFRYAPAGQTGFGHTNAYRYELAAFSPTATNANQLNSTD